MRKVLSFLSAACLLLCLCACKGGNSKPEDFKKIPSDFSASLTVQSGELTLKADLLYKTDALCEVKITSPPLSGMTLCITADDVQIEYLGLSYRNSQSTFPETAFVHLLFSACKEMGKVQSTVPVVSGTSAVYKGGEGIGEFELCTDTETGFIEKIHFPKAALTIAFQNFKAL